MAVYTVCNPKLLVSTIEAIPQAQKPSTKSHLPLPFISGPLLGHCGLILRCSCVLGTDDAIVHLLGAPLYSENWLFNEGDDVEMYRK